LAGIRHLLMDAGVGEHVPTARASAWVVLVLAFICIICLGVFLL
jgi:succinate dehydrogenase / fumarate reductase cytochrome b subunit